MKLTKIEKLRILRNFLIELPIDLLAFIIVPIALLWCKKDDERLPKIFRWWDEERYGINGEILQNGKVIHSDEGHCGINGRFPRPKNRTYYARLGWLLRNRIGIFTTEIMGFRFLEINPTTIQVWGDRNTPSYSGSKGSSWGLVRAKTFDGKPVFSYFANIVWCKWFYVRVFVGHKIFDIADIAEKKTDREKIEAMQEFLNNPQSKIYAKSVCAIHPMRMVKR